MVYLRLLKTAKHTVVFLKKKELQAFNPPFDMSQNEDHAQHDCPGEDVKRLGMRRQVLSLNRFISVNILCLDVRRPVPFPGIHPSRYGTPCF
jgi:hypothetical protein